jgi:hypothetical protein
VTGGTRGALIGTSVVLVLAIGWFLMSHLVMKTSIPDAIGEATGVALGLLIVVSVVGAIVSKRQP